MRGRLFFVSFVLLSAALFCAHADEPAPLPLSVKIKSGQPGNLFLEGAKLRFTVTFTDEPSSRPALIEFRILNHENVEAYRREYAVPGGNPPRMVLTTSPPPQGYYTCVFSAVLPDGRPAEAFQKFAVIRKHRGLFAPDESPFGVDGFFSWRLKDPGDARAACEALQRAGIFWVRDRISWNDVQPRPGVWDWSRYDVMLKAQADEKMRVLQVFHDTAAWASVERMAPASIAQRYAPEDSLNLYQFLWNASARYKREVAAWELWNEFDIPIFFLGPAEEYARVLKASSLGVRGGNPKAAVLSGSVTFGEGLISFGGETWHDTEGVRMIEKVLENGGGEYFDVFNVHCYGPAEAVTGRIRLCRELLRRHGYDKPVWLTEFGSASTPVMKKSVDPSEREQAAWLVRAATLALAEGVQRFFYFSLPDFTEQGTSFWGILEHGRGGWQPKPAFAALANMAHTLDGMTWYGRYETSMSVEAHLFSNGRAGCMVLWSRGGQTLKPTLFFRKNQKNVMIRGLYGRDEPAASGLACTVFVSDHPVFVHGFDLYDLIEERIIKSDTLTPAGPSPHHGGLREAWVEIRPAKRTISLDDSMTSLGLTVHNVAAAAMEGDVSLSVLLPGKTSPVYESRLPAVLSPAVPLAISRDIPLRREWLLNLAGTPNSELRISAQFEDRAAGRKTTPAVTYLAFQPPVTLKRIPLLDALAPDIVTTLTVTSAARESLPVSIALAADAPWEVVPTTRTLELAPGETRHAAFFLSGRPWQPGDAAVSKTFISAKAGGVVAHRSDYLEFGELPRAFVPFNVDGAPDGWKYFPPFTLEGRDNVVLGRDFLKKDIPMRGRVHMAWDEQNLYVYVVTQDESVTNPARAKNPWMGDAVELFLDLRPESELGKPEYGPGVYQIFAVPADSIHNKPMLRVWQPDGHYLDNAQIASIATGDFWAVEISIPWKSLTESPVHTGRAIGFEAVLDDLDEGDYAHRQMIWRGGAENWRDPSLFSRLILVDHPRRRF